MPSGNLHTQLRPRIRRKAEPAKLRRAPSNAAVRFKVPGPALTRPSADIVATVADAPMLPFTTTVANGRDGWISAVPVLPGLTCRVVDREAGGFRQLPEEPPRARTSISG
jgi:hypothetical protein